VVSSTDVIATNLHPATNKCPTCGKVTLERWQQVAATVPVGSVKSSTSLSKCVYGDRLAKRTLVLTGDSQAWMWEPAFDKWGRANQWKVIVLAKGCASVARRSAGVLNNAAFPACAIFQSNVVKYIRHDAPKRRRRRRLESASRHLPLLASNPTEDICDLDRAIKARVLIVNPSPSFYAYDYSAHSTLSAPTCVVSHASQLRVCDIARNCSWTIS